ncbi:ATP-dependent protease LonB [Pseudobacillus wudalianchiensis]|uniref:endopeptidase La n=1 Tax=Pseudobacillus wudalianchiensis TaxID=1743143 RepID=A0A1B9B8H9_9BACI|nr:ATP-dependent protease LonB [Bacillus wudalianchiensis]OCA92373.1 ATP-dependent protease LonB [Bacillus wudalianchiensis]
MNWTAVAIAGQLVFGLIISLYFLTMLKKQYASKITIDKESKKEMEAMRKMRAISLTKPLAEKIRPQNFSDIVGQEEGIKALRAALCGAHPQHVIVYGPPGVGKTAAARLVLEEAKRSKHSPFAQNAVFVELDATTARFDERGIADPLIGSVHDPIYQGAGALGQAGIPQPKKGAVSNAHGGILFIDEIGELHPIQMNKLLKVLEDRKVILESAYYSEENENIPRHIHDIFQKGLPADFRLIGATTRQPEEIPAAIRSRCQEVYFNELDHKHLTNIARKAAEKAGMALSEKGLALIAGHTRNGREAVNLVQMASGIAMMENKKEILDQEVEWVIRSSRLSPKWESRIPEKSKVGLINGLAVTGPNSGALLGIEAAVLPANEKGTVTVTGIIEEETFNQSAKSIKRKSMAKGSVENAVTVLKSIGVPVEQFNIFVNFPGGMPVDGPSAGAAIALSIYSAIYGHPADHTSAITGEISLHGQIKPVGGVLQKVLAAKEAGAKKVLFPKENESLLLEKVEGIELIPISELEEAFDHFFDKEAERKGLVQPGNILSKEKKSI